MTKDEFISKYHKQKVLKFEPPTWEEFLATRDIDNGMWACWNCDDFDVSIVMQEENNEIGVLHSGNEFIIDCGYYSRTIRYNNELDIAWGLGNNREEMYYKALDIAQKWFLGEEE